MEQRRGPIAINTLKINQRDLDAGRTKIKVLYFFKTTLFFLDISNIIIHL